MSHPILSLVIPTRERAVTLGYALRSALDQRSEAFEIIVSDNCSTDNTQEVVGALDDPRLRYVRAETRLSMCDNYELALSQARGTYVCFIGDDDAVTPGGIDFLLSRLETLSEPTIHMWPMHVYDWPGVDSPGRVAHLAPQGREERLRIGDVARTAVRLGGWKYYGLPSPYHCAVPRWMLEAIRERTGRVFNSTQPDVFTAMALPAYAEEAVRLNTMVTLHGRSPSSNGAGFVKRSAQANIDRFIREYGDYAFHPTLDPEAPASANMIPDAVLIAKELYPEVYGTTPFNYSAMWAYVCRLGFEAPGNVLRRWRCIRRHHPLHLPTFLYYTVVHRLAIMRRKLIDARMISSDLRTSGPATILEFLDKLARDRSPILPPAR